MPAKQNLRHFDFRAVQYFIGMMLPHGAKTQTNCIDTCIPRKKDSFHEIVCIAVQLSLSTSFTKLASILKMSADGGGKRITVGPLGVCEVQGVIFHLDGGASLLVPMCPPPPQLPSGHFCAEDIAHYVVATYTD